MTARVPAKVTRRATRAMLDRIYEEYFGKLHEMRATVSDDRRNAEEIRLWEETERKLAHAWSAKGASLH